VGWIEWLIATVLTGGITGMLVAYWAIDKELDTLTSRVKQLEKETYLLELDRKIDKLDQEDWS
jgi:hypothetical protein